QKQLLGAGGALLVLVAFLAGNAVFVVMTAMVLGAFVAAYSTEDSERRAVFLVILAASAALLACELVYIKDPYGEKLYRMNTIFKLYLQAWFLFAVAGPWCVQQIAERRQSSFVRYVALSTVGCLFLA